MTFTDRLKSLRIEKSNTQKDIARALNTTDDTIYSWEKGRSQPSLEMLSKLADYFECSIDYLTGREDDFGVIKVSGEKQLSNLQKEILYYFDKMDDSQKNRLIGYAYAMIN